MNCRCGITVCRYTGFAHFHSICKLNMLRDMRKFLVSPFDVVGTFIYDILYQKDSICPYASTSQRCLERFPHTETEKSSFWWNVHHWLHWKLSKWQLPVQPVMKISSKWRHFCFSVITCPLWGDQHCRTSLIFFVSNLDKLLNKPSICMWF